MLNPVSYSYRAIVRCNWQVSFKVTADLMEVNLNRAAE